MPDPELPSATSAAYAVPIAGADGKLAIGFIPDVPPSGAAGGVLSGTYPNPGFAADMATQAELDTAIATRQATSEKDAASGYAGLSSASRITKGAITTDDLIVNEAAKGLVLKDAAAPAHYWRVTITTLGVLSTADLGTSPP